jgi:hypothetical protein
MKNFIKHKLLEYLTIVDESNIVTIDKISPDADEITRNIVFPVAKSLYRGINKLKRKDYEGLTNDEKTNIENFFPNMIDDETKGWKRGFKHTEGYVRPEKFFKIYNVKTLDGKNKKVSVGFFYDKKSDDIAYFESGNYGIAINLAKLNMNNLNQLESTIRHELVHSADPKVTKKTLRKRIEKKEKEYDKLPYEFDAFTHEFITTIHKNISMIDDNNEIKDTLIINLWSIINDLKNGFSANLLYREHYNNAIIRLFSENGVTSKNIKGLRDNYYQFLVTVQNWASKPTLFDRFVKRLVRYVPYKN